MMIVKQRFDCYDLVQCFNLCNIAITRVRYVIKYAYFSMTINKP